MTNPRLLLLTTLTALWACSDGGLPREYRGLQVPEDLLASEAARAEGRRLYLKECALCHGERADGHGRRRNLSTPARDLTDAYWQAGTSARELFFVVRQGVPGTAMPAFRSLSERQAWEVVSFLLSLNDSSAAAPVEEELGRADD